MSNEIAKIHEEQVLSKNLDMFEVMEKAWSFAEKIAKADIIPKHYQGNPSNCFIAVQSAFRMNVDPFLIMQSTFVVQGTLGMKAQYAIASANSRGLFEDNIRFEVKNKGLRAFKKTGFDKELDKNYEDIEVTAHAIFKRSKKPIKFTATMQMAVDDDWVKNSKYVSIPEVMLTYRAATFLIRTHCPEVLLGMYTVEELEDIAASKAKNITGTSKVDELAFMIKAIPVVAQEPANDINNAAPPTDTLDTVDMATSESVLQKELAADLIVAIRTKDVPQDIVDKWLKAAKVERLEEMSSEHLTKCIRHIDKEY